jgi:hypothetical protein
MLRTLTASCLLVVMLIGSSHLSIDHAAYHCTHATNITIDVLKQFVAQGLDEKLKKTQRRLGKQPY